MVSQALACQAEGQWTVCQRWAGLGAAGRCQLGSQRDGALGNGGAGWSWAAASRPEGKGLRELQGVHQEAQLVSGCWARAPAWAFPSLSPCASSPPPLSLVRTLVVGVRAHPGKPGLVFRPLTNYTCRELFAHTVPFADSEGGDGASSVQGDFSTSLRPAQPGASPWVLCSRAWNLFLRLRPCAGRREPAGLPGGGASTDPKGQASRDIHVPGGHCRHAAAQVRGWRGVHAPLGLRLHPAQ